MKEGSRLRKLTSIEFCAGAGGQALGLEAAGFSHKLLVDNDPYCCESLRANRDFWNIQCADMNVFDASPYKGVDLLAGGLPCPPFSLAGKQLGSDDERDLFPAALRITQQVQPKFILIENVKGFLGPKFQSYREALKQRWRELGYQIDWRLYNASDFGVSQLRPRVAIVGALEKYWGNFCFPSPTSQNPESVGELLYDLMAENGWHGASNWADEARGIAPTIVGGSKKHGGPDLGPTRARAAWKAMGVNGSSIAEEAPEKDFEGIPRLTTRMVSRLQGFPDEWVFSGRKTNAYRQIGNAFPPPVAEALGRSIAQAIRKHETEDKQARAAFAAE